MLLGGIVTVTHTIGVFALGLVTLLLSQFIVPEALYPWLTLASGVLVIAVGASVLVGRFRRRGHAHVITTTTAIRTITITGTRTGSTGAGCWASASRPACCRAPPRSSSC